MVKKLRKTRKTFGRKKSRLSTLRAKVKSPIKLTRKEEIEAIRDGAYAEGFEEGARLGNRPCRIVEETWTMNDGSKVAVRHMDEDHLRNAISYLTRNLIFKLGQSLYLGDLKTKISGLAMLLTEADRRGLKV